MAHATFSFVILVPYKYVAGENAQMDAFLTHFEDLPTSGNYELQIIIQPNKKLIRNSIFDLKVKTRDFSEWTRVAKVRSLPPGSKFKYRYKILEVYQEGLGKKVRDTSLAVDKILAWQRKPPATNYAFSESTADDFELFVKDASGQSGARLARCRKLSSTINMKCRWKIMEVYVAGKGHKIGAGGTLPDVVGVVQDEKILEWSSTSGPRKYVFVNIDQQQNDVTNYAIWEEERNKWQSKNLAINVKVLPLLHWQNLPTDELNIQYGFFRNSLLQHEETKMILEQERQKGKEVYVHIFDPDIQSLLVNTQSDLEPGTELLFEVYVRHFRSYYNSKNIYPALMSTYYCFDHNQRNLNRLFVLNKELNSIVHTHLPGAGYFSECNTVIRYQQEYWNTLEFARDDKEIIPIVKKLSRDGLPVLFEDGALVTAIPERMDIYKTMENFLLYDLIHDETHRSIREDRDFFRWLPRCPQVMLSTLKWSRHALSAIAGYLKPGQDYQSVQQSLSRLWMYYSPIELYKYLKLPDNCYRKFKTLCGAYKLILHTQIVKDNLHQAMKELYRIELKENCPFTWDNCETAAKKCGEACVKHFLKWMDMDEMEEAVEEEED